MLTILARTAQTAVQGPLLLWPACLSQLMIHLTPNAFLLYDGYHGTGPFPRSRRQYYAATQCLYLC
jgi:hypothetical protein